MARNQQLTHYKKPITIEILSTLIVKHRGNISSVAKALHVDRNTIYNRMKEFPDLVNVVIQAREQELDEAEGALQKQIRAGNIAAIIFFLKTRGRARGYIERQDNLNLNFDLNRLTNEQLSRLANGEDIHSILATPGEGAA